MVILSEWHAVSSVVQTRVVTCMYLDLVHRRLTPDFIFLYYYSGGTHCVSYGIDYACTIFFFFPGVFLHSKVTGACVL